MNLSDGSEGTPVRTVPAFPSRLSNQSCILIDSSPEPETPVLPGGGTGTTPGVQLTQGFAVARESTYTPGRMTHETWQAGGVGFSQHLSERPAEGGCKPEPNQHIFAGSRQYAQPGQGQPPQLKFEPMVGRVGKTSKSVPRKSTHPSLQVVGHQAAAVKQESADLSAGTSSGGQFVFRTPKGRGFIKRHITPGSQAPGPSMNRQRIFNDNSGAGTQYGTPELEPLPKLPRQSVKSLDSTPKSSKPGVVASSGSGVKVKREKGAPDKYQVPVTGLFLLPSYYFRRFYCLFRLDFL